MMSLLAIYEVIVKSSAGRMISLYFMQMLAIYDVIVKSSALFSLEMLLNDVITNCRSRSEMMSFERTAMMSG